MRSVKKKATTASLFPGLLPSDNAAVDDLLRAAEDDLLLNLRVDAHSTSRPSSGISSSSSAASLDPDLARRFEALRSAPPPPRPTTSTAAAVRFAAKTAGDDGDDWGRILGDDLDARFAALKGTPTDTTAALNPATDGEGRERCPKGPIEEEEEDEDDVDEDGVSKKEVEKLMQWAKDAARLDPSTKSDEEDEDDDDEEEEEEMETKKKLQQLKEPQRKNKPRKWFFF